MHVYFTTQQITLYMLCFKAYLYISRSKLKHVRLPWFWKQALEDVVGPDSFVLGFGICGLTYVCLSYHSQSRVIRGHDVCNVLTGRPNWCLLARGGGTIFLLLGQAAPLAFFSLSSLPLPSRFHPLPIPFFISMPLLLPFRPLPFPSLHV